jgi:hypothetical protein
MSSGSFTRHAGRMSEVKGSSQSKRDLDSPGKRCAGATCGHIHRHDRITVRFTRNCRGIKSYVKKEDLKPGAKENKKEKLCDEC